MSERLSAESASLSGPYLDVGCHLGLIYSLAACHLGDGKGALLCSCGADKTLRIWGAEGGDLRAVIRPPAGEGRLGRVVDCGLSLWQGGTGLSLAVVGDFVDPEEGSADTEARVFYLYHLDPNGRPSSAAPVARVSGLLSGLFYPQVVGLSSGDFLIRGYFAQPNGKPGLELRRYNQEGTLVVSLPLSSFQAKIATGPSLLAVSTNQSVALYDTNMQLLRSFQLGRESVSHMALSPDEGELALLYDDHRVALYRTSDLSMTEVKTVADEVKKKVSGLSSAHVYYGPGGGLHLVSGLQYRKDKDSDGVPAMIRLPSEVYPLEVSPDLAGGRYQVLLRGTLEESLVFVQELDRFEVVDGLGKRRYASKTQGYPMRPGPLSVDSSSLVVSQDACSFRMSYQIPVEVPRSRKPPVLDLVGFSLAEPGFVEPGKVRGAAPQPLPDKEAEEVWGNVQAPIWCSVLLEGGKTALVGASETLCFVDFTEDEIVRWRIEMPASPFALNVSPSGQVAVVACTDGQIRWYRTKDGKLLCTLFASRTGSDDPFVLFAPSGEFFGNQGGVGFLQGGKKEVDPAFFWRLVRTLDLDLATRGVIGVDGMDAPLKDDPGRDKEASLRDPAGVAPVLYLLAVGVGAYNEPALRLIFPAKDAADIVAHFQGQKGVLYRDVQVKLLQDEGATLKELLSGLEWLQRQTTANDVALIFLCGHGVTDPATSRYYFLPKEADPNQIKTTMLPDDEIRHTLANIPGKALLFLDTCHAGELYADRKFRGSPGTSRFLAELTQADNGIVVFAAATARQSSQESGRWGNGAFTKAVLEGLAGAADHGKTGRVTVSMLNLYVSERVKSLTEGTQAPTMAIPASLPDFPLSVCS